ncbi:hypothetical protein FKW77_001295 [Venturia effusa]|uniref:Uncharacterized protein n=1 Tax=Venturia effusa TaxID=50376 RepID=A0A517L8L4_9PEZI|nr:hypothetical protein FKW77_001295 [Venturia effusa]
MSARQQKNENFYKQRSKVNRSKASNQPKVPSKKANRSKANKAFQPPPTSYSRDHSNTYRDLRSVSVMKRRERTRNYKYYNFSVVKAGQLELQQCKAETRPEITTQWHNPHPLEIFELPAVSITKKSLYNEAQRTAPRNRRQSCCWKCDKVYNKQAQRHELEAKKIASDLNTKGEYWDFSGLDPQRVHDYLLSDWGRESDDDAGFDVSNCEGERPLSPCRCDECVWARYGYLSSSDEEGATEVYEGIGTMTAEPKPEPAPTEEDWTGWFTHEALFDQNSQFVDAPTQKRDTFVETDLGWLNACGDEESQDMDTNVAGWLEVWDADWLDWRAYPKTESEHSFEMV